MYYPARTGADPVPLDFNALVRTESVTDALVSEPAPSGKSRAPAPESLLVQIGLSGHLARAVVAERSGPGGWE